MALESKAQTEKNVAAHTFHFSLSYCDYGFPFPAFWPPRGA